MAFAGQTKERSHIRICNLKRITPSITCLALMLLPPCQRASVWESTSERVDDMWKWGPTRFSALKLKRLKRCNDHEKSFRYI